MGAKTKKFFKKAGAVVKKAAPWIFEAMPGPWGGMANAVLKGVTGKQAHEIDELIAGGDPEIYAKLELAEIEFRKQMENNKVKFEELRLADVQSARDMRVQLRDWTPTVLAVISMGFFAWLVTAIFSDLEIVEKHGEFVYYLFGFGTSIVKQVFDFFLGSSIGSKQKDDYNWSKE